MCAHSARDQLQLKVRGQRKRRSNRDVGGGGWRKKNDRGRRASESEDKATHKRKIPREYWRSNAILPRMRQATTRVSTVVAGLLSLLRY